MPAAMTHLIAARDYLERYCGADKAIPESGRGLFYAGNVAPDYIDMRAVKDIIHLRTVTDRLGALKELKDSADPANAFDRGWLLHLFCDLHWDTEVIPKYREAFENSGREGSWFLCYRSEQGRSSHRVAHELKWSGEVFNLMRKADLSDMRGIGTVMAVPLELNWFIDRVVRRHTHGNTTESDFFTTEFVTSFASRMAESFNEWYRK